MNSSESHVTDTAESKPTPKKTFLQERLQSLDAYRWLIMITLAFTGFGLAPTATKQLNGPFLSAASAVGSIGSPVGQWTLIPAAAAANEHPPEFPLWRTIHFQFSHVEWTDCGYWDLIQPSFLFMVGVTMAFSFNRRQSNLP